MTYLADRVFRQDSLGYSVFKGPCLLSRKVSKLVIAAPNLAESPTQRDRSDEDTCTHESEGDIFFLRASTSRMRARAFDCGHAVEVELRTISFGSLTY